MHVDVAVGVVVALRSSKNISGRSVVWSVAMAACFALFGLVWVKCAAHLYLYQSISLSVSVSVAVYLLATGLWARYICILYVCLSVCMSLSLCVERETPLCVSAYLYCVRSRKGCLGRRAIYQMLLIYIELLCDTVLYCSTDIFVYIWPV